MDLIGNKKRKRIARPCEFRQKQGYGGSYGGSRRGITNPYMDCLGSENGQSNDVGQTNSSNADTGMAITTPFPAVQHSHQAAPATADPPAWAHVPTTPNTFRDLQPYAAGGGAGSGAELSFGRRLVNYGGNQIVTPYYNTKMAINGSDSVRWTPTSGYPTTPPILFDQWTARIDAQMAATGKRLGWIRFKQGETDCDSDAESAAGVFSGKRQAILNALVAKYPWPWLWIETLVNPNTLPPSIPNITVTRRDAIIAEQRAFAAANPTRVRIVESDRAELDNNDALHYGPRGNWRIGEEEAEVLLDAIAPNRNTNRNGITDLTSPWIQDIGVMSTGSNTASSGNFLAPAPCRAQIGDVEILIVSNSATNVTPALTTAQGFTSIAVASSTTGGSFQLGGLWMRTIDSTLLGGGTRKYALDPLITDNIQRKRAAIFSIRNTSGLGATATSANNANNTTLNIAGITTTKANSLIVLIPTYFAGGTPTVSSLTNSNITNLAVYRHTILNQGFTIAAGTVAGNGVAIGTSALTLSSAAIIAAHTLEFKAP